MVYCTKVVEVLGLPRGGKSTYLRNVLRELEDLGITLKFIPDKIWDAQGADEMEKNEWVLAEIRKILIETRSPDLALIIIERGAWACLASIIAHSKTNGKFNGKKAKKRIEELKRLALDLAQHEDFFILVEISPEEVIKRDKETGATQSGKIINPVFLSFLEKAYQEVYGQMPVSKTKIVNGHDDLFKNQEKIKKMLINLIPESKSNGKNNLEK